MRTVDERELHQGGGQGLVSGTTMTDQSMTPVRAVFEDTGWGRLTGSDLLLTEL